MKYGDQNQHRIQVSNQLLLKPNQTFYFFCYISISAKSSLGIKDTQIMLHRLLNKIKLISEVMQWQLGEVFHKIWAVAVACNF